MTILDWRDSADYSLLTRRANAGTARALFDKRGQIAMRYPPDVRAIMWHITACLFGVSPAAVKAAGGDRRLARNARARRIPAHVTAFRDGDAVVPFALRSYLYHGNAGNPFAVGIEIESVDGTVTPEQAKTLRELVPWLIAEAKREGMLLRENWAHRQTHGGKSNDPGPTVWRDVVIPLSEAHGLTRTIVALPRSTPKGRDGTPIPRSWDPLGV